MIYPDWLGETTSGGTVTVYADAYTAIIEDAPLLVEIEDETLYATLDDDALIAELRE
jgi:hypothetical protein